MPFTRHRRQPTVHTRPNIRKERCASRSGKLMPKAIGVEKTVLRRALGAVAVYARRAVDRANGFVYRSSIWPGRTTPLAANMCSTVRFWRFCLFCTLRNFMYWISEVMTSIFFSFSTKGISMLSA